MDDVVSYKLMHVLYTIMFVIGIRIMFLLFIIYIIIHSHGTETTSVPTTPYLVVANEQFIREITPDGQSFRTILTGLKNAQGLSYHYRYSNVSVFSQQCKSMTVVEVIHTEIIINFNSS